MDMFVTLMTAYQLKFEKDVGVYSWRLNESLLQMLFMIATTTSSRE